MCKQVHVLIRTLFLVRKIPIPRFPESDEMVWLEEKSGNFSVNSAYWVDHHHKIFKLMLVFGGSCGAVDCLKDTRCCYGEWQWVL